MSPEQSVHIDVSHAFQSLHAKVFFVDPKTSAYALAYGKPPGGTRLPFSETSRLTVADFFNGIVLELNANQGETSLEDLVGCMHAILDEVQQEDIPAVMALRHNIPRFVHMLLGVDATDSSQASIAARIRDIHDQAVRERAQKSNW